MVTKFQRRQAIVAAIVSVLLIAGVALALSFSQGSGSSGTTTTTGNVGTTIPFDIKYNARADVTGGKCTNTSGNWKFAAKIHNSASVSRRYQIVVDYVTVPGNTVEDTKIVTISSVGPQATWWWSVHGAQNLLNVNCVIRHVQAWPTN